MCALLPLTSILEGIARRLEELMPELRVSIALLDDDDDEDDAAGGGPALLDDDAANGLRASGISANICARISAEGGADAAGMRLTA